MISPKLIKLFNLVHFLFDAKKSKMTDVALSIVAHLPVKLIFDGDNFLMRTEKNKQRIYWYWLYSTLREFKDKLLTT
jgi:hypothetical protein